YSLADFLDPAIGFAHINRARDHENVFSTVDLWDFDVDYNQLSVDFTKPDGNGGFEKYEYSFADITKRHEVLGYGSSILKAAILGNEDAKKAEAISVQDHYVQYTTQFGTDSAIFLWAQFYAEVLSDFTEVGIAYVAIRQVSRLFRAATPAKRKGFWQKAVDKIKKLFKSKIDEYVGDKMASGGLKNFANKIKGKKNVALSHTDEGVEKLEIHSYRTNGNGNGEVKSIAHFQKEGGKDVFIIKSSEIDNTLSGTETDVIAPFVKNENGQYLKNVKMVELEDGRIFFKGEVDELMNIPTFRNALTDNPSLESVWRNTGSSGRQSIADMEANGILQANLDQYIRLRDARIKISLGENSLIVSVRRSQLQSGMNIIDPNATLVSSVSHPNHTNVQFLPDPDLNLNDPQVLQAFQDRMLAYINIANNPSQIDDVATELAKSIHGSNYSGSQYNYIKGKVSEVHQHFFVNEHLAEVGAGEFAIGRFVPQTAFSDGWTQAVNGNITEEFKRFIAHENVEASSMRAGMHYQARYDPVQDYIPPPTPLNYGAHELAPIGDVNNTNHFFLWGTNFLDRNIPSNLIFSSNNDLILGLDDVRNHIKNVEQY
ncbi:MAG: hypothetical protein AAF985_07415, partial [Bacteroidota bacterium]